MRKTVSKKRRQIIFSVCSFICFLFFTSLGAQVGGKLVSWRQALDQDPEWYASDEALRIADNLLIYQHETGGWPKNIDMASKLNKEEIREIEISRLVQDPAKT